MDTLTRYYFQESKKYIVDGVKGMHRISCMEEFPMYFCYGKDAYVWDMDGKKYIDFVMGKGPYILGYRNEIVENAVIEQVKCGNIFPAGNPLHLHLAKKIKQCMPSFEKMLFYKTGSCATQAAIRIARNYKGKSRILTSGYHGWHEWYEKNEGEIVEFDYSLEKLEQELKSSNDNAAVIVTPEAFYFSEKYYKTLEVLCKKYEVVLILDEVKTGFRVDIAGFQGKYKIHPDLTIVSKAIANGYSVSVLGGKAEVMNEASNIHTAGTFDTEAIPFAAALATIHVLEEKKVLTGIENLGRWFTEEMERIFEKNDVPINIIWSNGSFRFWFSNKEVEDSFIKESIKNGICFYPYDNSFISYAHSKECLNKVIDICDCRVVKNLPSQYCGYEKFECNYIGKKLVNRKGFLNKYPGKEG